MTLNRIACPECGAGLRSSTGFKPGQTASCPKCETDFTVEAPANATLSIDDEDEQPGKKKRGDEWAYKNSWMRYAVLGVLLAVLGVLGYMLYDKKMNEGKETAGVRGGEDEEFKPITPKATLPPGMGPLPQLNPAGGGAAPPPKAKLEPNGKAFNAAEAKALLVGNWESKTKDADRSVEYDADGLFSYTVETEGNEPKKTIQGQWKVTELKREPNSAGQSETTLVIEWTAEGKPAVKSQAVVKADGTLQHPQIERGSDGSMSPVTFTKKK